ncbi:MAG: hypothetical protein HRU70_01595 [Phycisphaeraceae bacterium]|nr:MAG: hypothetical protein HRU70_01595 [Phycisphaeraceae bacterium]
MSQFGMQMPASRAKRGASLDVFAVLAFLSLVFLAVACVVMYQAASKISPDGTPFTFQAEPGGNTEMKFQNAAK